MSNEARRAHLDELRKQAAQGGGDKRIAAQHGKGKLTARERLALLLDGGSFQEIEMLSTHRCTSFGMDAEHYLGDSVVSGLGARRRPAHCRLQPGLYRLRRQPLRARRRQDVSRSWTWAMRHGTPIVGLNDSGGARIQEGVLSLDGYARIFTRHTMASGVVPQISVQLGPTAPAAASTPPASPTS